VAREAKPPRRLRRMPAGDLARLRSALWQAVARVEAILLDPDAERGDVLRASHALSQAAAAYQRVLEAGDLLERLELLERVVHERGHA
jgi:hypothetical protein